MCQNLRYVWLITIPPNPLIIEYYHKNPGKGAIRNTPLIDWIYDVPGTNNMRPIWETNMSNIEDWREAVHKENPDLWGRESWFLGKGLVEWKLFTTYRSDYFGVTGFC